MKEKEYTYHESQVNVRLSRINGSGNRFYGSDIECNSYVELTINKSEVKRDLGHDWFFPKGKPLMQIRMTPNQFTTLITTLNTGSGVPATLERINSDGLPYKIEEPPYHNKLEQIKETFDDFVLEADEDLQSLKSKITNLKLSKVKTRELLFSVERIESYHKKNIKFWVEQAGKEIGNMVTSAKATVENYYINLLSRLGVKALKEGKVKLIDKETN